MSHQARLKDDLDNVIIKYPELEIFSKNQQPYKLEGLVEVVDLQDQFRGSFEVRVVIPEGYPHSFPSLRELSRLIPRTLDRHVYPSGFCCVTVLQKQLIESRKGIEIKRYMSDYVIPYLANQIHFKEYNEWANGEYKHGHFGQIQFYEEILGLASWQMVLHAFQLAIGSSSLDGRGQCFCGKGKIYRKCHLPKVEELKFIDRAQLIEDAKMIFAHHLIQYRK